MNLTRLLVALAILSTVAVFTLGYAGVALVEAGETTLGAVAVIVAMATACLPVMLSLFAHDAHTYGTVS